MARNVELQRATQVLNKLQRATGNEKRLNPEQQLWYREWRARRSATGMTDEQLAAFYETSLDANYVDRDPIRADIEAVLNANVPVIYKSDTDEQAAEKYYRYSQNN